MNTLKHIVLPVFIIAVSLFCTAFFRVIPASRLWNGYSVLYVQKDAGQSRVLELFSEYGIKKYISIYNQKVPLSNPVLSAEYALSSLSFSNYLEDRKGYFYDRSGNYLVYYVPDSFEGELHHVVQALNREGISSGVNANSAYPWMSFVFCLAFALFLVWKSDRKVLALVLNFVPVFFTLTMPFYTVAVSQCLMMTMAFYAVRYWNRKGAFSCLLGNKKFLLLFSFSLVLLFFTTIKVFLFFILSLVTSGCMIYVYREVVEFFESRYVFRPVLIRSAPFIRPVTKSNRNIFFASSIASLLILLSAFVSSRTVDFSSGASGKNIMLPAKNSAKKSLPGLNDYVLWNWQAITFPYRSLNDGEGSNPNSMIFPRYEEKNGLVSESFNSIEYNDYFRQNVLKAIDSLEYDSIEAMLKRQGTYSGAGYSSSGSSSVSFFTFILLFAGAMIPASFYFVYSAGKDKKQEKK